MSSRIPKVVCVTATVFLFALSAGLLLPSPSFGSLDAVASARKSVVMVRVTREDGRVHTGSGVVISSSGIIATSASLASPASADPSRLTIQTDNSGPIVAEQIIMTDEGHGIALLRVSGRGLLPAKLAPEYRPKKGDHFYVVGNPRASTPLVLGGTVNSQPRAGLLELDLKVPPENDGGPVLNTKGEVIGIIINRPEGGGDVRRAVPVKQLSDIIGAYRKKQLSSAYFELGLLYDAEQGRAADAAAALRESLRVDPGYADAYNNLGVIYGKMGRYPEAIEALNQVIRIKPAFAEAYFNLGVALSKTGRLSESVDAFRQLLLIRPNDADALQRLSMVYGKLGQYQAAADSAELAVRIRPGFAEAYNSLGVAYGSMGRNTEAVASFRQVLKIRPDYAEARYLLAVVFLSMGDRDSARHEYELLREIDGALSEKLSKFLGNQDR